MKHKMKNETKFRVTAAGNARLSKFNNIVNLLTKLSKKNGSEYIVAIGEDNLSVNGKGVNMQVHFTQIDRIVEHIGKFTSSIEQPAKVVKDEIKIVEDAKANVNEADLKDVITYTDETGNSVDVYKENLVNMKPVELKKILTSMGHNTDPQMKKIDLINLLKSL